MVIPLSSALTQLGDILARPSGRPWRCYTSWQGHAIPSETCLAMNARQPTEPDIISMKYH